MGVMMVVTTSRDFLPIHAPYVFLGDVIMSFSLILGAIMCLSVILKNRPCAMIN